MSGADDCAASRRLIEKLYGWDRIVVKNVISILQSGGRSRPSRTL
jgi:hypothetical protein